MDGAMVLAITLAGLFGVALVAATRQGRRHRQDEHLTLLTEIDLVQHARVTTERLDRWVPSVVTERASDEDEGPAARAV